MIAGFIMLQFGNDVTRTMVKGTYNLMRHMYASNPSIDYNSMADVHSLNMQRAYNYLCLAYGKDAASIKDLADAWLPPARKPDCANEYQQALSAFDKTIMPSVDQTLLAKVRGMQILRADDSKL
jgi:hypothetical protein